MASIENPSSNTQYQGFRSRLKKNSILQDPLVSSPPPTPPPPPPSLQTTRCKPSIPSLFLSTFTPNNPTTSSSSSSTKKKSFASATFRGLGCASPSEVLVPDAIRSSADWQAKKARKKKQRKKKHGQVVVPDVWCSPGIAFAADAASVDCVVSRRPPAAVGRGRADGERNQGERSCIGRRNNILEQMPIMDSPSALEALRSGHHRYLRGLRRSPGGLAEIMMLQTGLLLSRPDAYDQYRDWRLDVDNMSYEELLELGDRIGCVSTGLREEEIVRCLKKMNHSMLDALPPHLSDGMDWKCSICQEEYEAEDEVGKLKCGHGYHLYCIKQWLMKKNACPVCKVAAAQY